MTESKRRKPHRITLDLSDEDHLLLAAIIEHEKDTAASALRRMIRSRHNRIFSPPKPQLTLRLPQSTPDFGSIATTKEKDTAK